MTFGSVSWESNFELRDFGSYTTAGCITVDTGTSADATASSNGKHLYAYYATWQLNNNLVLSGGGKLTIRAFQSKGVQGPGGFIVESGEIEFDATHGGHNYTYTGGVTVKNAGLVDVDVSMGALGDGLLTIEEGGVVQASNSAFDQDVLFDINSTGTTSAFITGGGANWNASGEWTFDLTDAGNTIGDSWNIIGVGGAATYGASFNVADFTESGGVWTGIANGAEYQFDEATGILGVTDVVKPIPEPATMALLGLAFAGLGGYVRKRRSI